MPHTPAPQSSFRSLASAVRSRLVPAVLSALAAAGPIAALAVAPAALAQYPEPSPYPVSWELSFEHAPLRRIVVQVPGQPQPQAYYYLAYTVTNDTDRELQFLPVLTMVTKEGKVIRSDQAVPVKVFDTIKDRLRDERLQDSINVAGTLRVGEDQQVRGVAIWPEPMREMGNFQIYVEGLSGETSPVPGPAGQPLADAEGRPLTLRKTLQLDYAVYGDEIRPQNDPVTKTAQRWVMR